MLNMKQKAELATTFMQPDNQPQMKRIHLSPKTPMTVAAAAP